MKPQLCRRLCATTLMLSVLATWLFLSLAGSDDSRLLLSPRVEILPPALRGRCHPEPAGGVTGEDRGETWVAEQQQVQQPPYQQRLCADAADWHSCWDFAMDCERTSVRRETSFLGLSSLQETIPCMRTTTVARMSFAC